MVYIYRHKTQQLIAKMCCVVNLRKVYKSGGPDTVFTLRCLRACGCPGGLYGRLLGTELEEPVVRAREAGRILRRGNTIGVLCRLRERRLCGPAVIAGTLSGLWRTREPLVILPMSGRTRTLVSHSRLKLSASSSSMLMKSCRSSCSPECTFCSRSIT